jgi:hypothetical protein
MPTQVPQKIVLQRVTRTRNLPPTDVELFVRTSRQDVKKRKSLARNNITMDLTCLLTSKDACVLMLSSIRMINIVQPGRRISRYDGGTISASAERLFGDACNNCDMLEKLIKKAEKKMKGLDMNTSMAIYAHVVIIEDTDNVMLCTFNQDNLLRFKIGKKQFTVFIYIGKAKKISERTATHIDAASMVVRKIYEEPMNIFNKNSVVFKDMKRAIFADVVMARYAYCYYVIPLHRIVGNEDINDKECELVKFFDTFDREYGLNRDSAKKK